MFKMQELEINPEDPFGNDKLKRKESAEVLTQLFNSIETPFVLSITSRWGTGKTTFVKMWKEFLSNDDNKFHCLYFNAWENDFSDDPLISFIGEMQTELVATLNEDASKAKEYFEKAKNISGSLAKRAIPALLRGLTYGALDLNEITEELIAEYVHTIAKEEIESYEKNKNTLKEFKSCLADFVEELANLNDGEGKPLIFFVDELDRCRPTYAVELLERVKHLFSVPGIIFVLVLDKYQLNHSIKALYGTGMDVDGYLRRFIDLEYQLPKPSTKDFSNHLFTEFGFKEFFKNRGKQLGFSHDEKHFFDTFVELADIFDLSLRQLEQCFTQISITFRTTPEDYKIYPLFLAFLIILKNVNWTLYNQYMTEAVSPTQAVNFIKAQPKGTEFLNDFYGQAVEAHLISAFCKNYDDLNRLATQYDEVLNNANSSEEQRTKATYILDALKSFSRFNDMNVGKYLFKKIEILDSFVIKT